MDGTVAERERLLRGKPAPDTFLAAVPHALRRSRRRPRCSRTRRRAWRPAAPGTSAGSSESTARGRPGGCAVRGADVVVEGPSPSSARRGDRARGATAGRGRRRCRRSPSRTSGRRPEVSEQARGRGGRRAGRARDRGAALRVEAKRLEHRHRALVVGDHLDEQSMSPHSRARRRAQRARSRPAHGRAARDRPQAEARPRGRASPGSGTTAT